MTESSAEVVGVPTDGGPDRQAVIRKAYSQATSDLRTKYNDEFVMDVQKYAKEAGVDWAPRPTAKDKARQTLEEILSEFPDLAR